MVTENEKITELKDLLRRSLGNVSLTQLTDAQAGDVITSAIREYSKYKPIKVLDLLMTEANKAVYDLSAKTRIMRVTDVFYSTGIEFSLDRDFRPETPGIGNIEGISLFENPSIWLQYMQRIERYKAMFDGDFDFDQGTKILRIIPAPTSAGKLVYYIWSQRHTSLTIPEDDYDGFLLWEQGRSKEMIATKMGQDIRSVSGYGESVSLGSSPDSVMKEALDLENRFKKMFGGGIIIAG